MKRAILLLLLICINEDVLAQARPSSPARSCEANRRSVTEGGAVVLGTGGHTFDRFVRDRGFCQFDEYLEPAWVPSSDTPQCFVGYRCKTNAPWE